MTTTEQEIAAEIRRLVREELRVEESFADAEELAARLDSLLLLALVTAVEDRFRVILSEEDAAATRSLADLARLVARKAAAAPPVPDRGQAASTPRTSTLAEKRPLGDFTPAANDRLKACVSANALRANARPRGTRLP